MKRRTSEVDVAWCAVRYFYGLSMCYVNWMQYLMQMHRTLQYRLAVAEDMRKAAEQEKLEKEEFARSALSELEVIMDKVAQESKMLQLEAEENSKVVNLSYTLLYWPSLFLVYQVTQ